MTYSYPVPPTSIDLEAANSVPLRIAEAQPALPKGLQPFMTLNPLLTEGSVPNGQGRDALDNPYLDDVDFSNLGEVKTSGTSPYFP